MKAYSFLLSFGYVESQSLGFVPFVCEKKFSSTKAAFIDLATFFKEHYVGEPKTFSKPCCIKSLESKLAFCGKCGRGLKQPEFDAEGYIEFVSGINGVDIDGYAQMVEDSSCDARWQADLPEDLNAAKFIYNAERCLAAAIGHSDSDKVTIDTIFKNHRKTNTFSFWG